MCVCMCATAMFQSSFCERIMAPKFTFLHWLSYQHKSEILMGKIDPKIAIERTKELFSMSASFLIVCSLLYLSFYHVSFFAAL